MVGLVLTCSKNQLVGLLEESTLSAGQNAAIATTEACTAHGNNDFAGDLPALYLKTQRHMEKIVVLDLSEMA